MAPDPLNVRRPRPFPRVVGRVLLLLVLTGCQVPATGSPSAPAASPAAPAEGAECASISLRTPRGAPIDLNGTWTSGTPEAGNQIRYQLRQSGECLWGRGYSAYQGQEPGQSFDMILFGTVHSDFTADVDVLELSVGNPQFYPHFGRAALTFGIRFDDVGGEEGVALEIIAIHARRIEGPGGGRFFPIGGPAVGQVLTR